SEPKSRWRIEWRDGGDIEVFMVDELADLQQLDHDKKLAELEAKVEALLKEIQALKGKPGDKADAQKHVEAGLRYLRALQDAKDKAKSDSTTARGLAALALAHGAKQEALPEVAYLLRVTYALPPGKAAALAGLLKEHAKATPLEAKVDGDKLIVTTTAQYQRVIHAVVDLLQDKAN
ncbi:MAG TPA: hypothetical protein VGZ47_09195, partial [Gemmataceae bacterium]|nr:hypothetical protein [Gemmataceae bacterium]